MLGKSEINSLLCGLCSVNLNVAVYMFLQFLWTKEFLKDEHSAEFRKQFTKQKQFRTREICMHLPATENQSYHSKV